MCYFFIIGKMSSRAVDWRLEMERAANSPVFFRKQSTKNFFSGDGIPGRCDLLANWAKIFVFANFQNLTRKCFAAVLSILRFG